MAAHPQSDQLIYATWGLLDSLLQSDARTTDIIAACEHAAALFPGNFEGHPGLRVMRAGLYRQTASLLGKQNTERDVAIKYIGKALALLSGTDEAETRGIRTELGSSYLALGDAKAAADLLRDVVRGDPNHQQAWFQLGRADEGLRDADAAIDAYVRARSVFEKPSVEGDKPLRRVFEARHGSMNRIRHPAYDGPVGVPRTRGPHETAVCCAGAPTGSSKTSRACRSAQPTIRDASLSWPSGCSWCPYCKHDLSQLDRVYSQFKGRAAIVGINVERPPAPSARLSAAKGFLSSHPIAFPIAVDLDDALPTFYGVEVFPTVFVLDRSGTIQYRNIGEADQLEAILDRQISSLLESTTEDLPPAAPVDRSPRANPTPRRCNSNAHGEPGPGGMARVADRALALVESRTDLKNLVSKSLSVAAHAREHLRDYSAAQALYERYVRALEVRPDTEPQTLRDALESLASAHLSSGNSASAEPIIARAVSLYERAGVSEQQRLAKMLFRLGNLYIGLRDFGKAREMLVRANTILRTRSPVDLVAVAESLVSLGSLYHSWGDDQRAIDYLEQATGPAKQAGGAGLSITVTLFGLLAHIYAESPQSGETGTRKSEQLYETNPGDCTRQRIQPQASLLASYTCRWPVSIPPGTIWTRRRPC